GSSFPRVALERQPEMILAVEALLLHPDNPDRVSELRGNAGEEPGAQRVDGLEAEQRQVTGSFRRFELRDVVAQLREVRLRKCGCAEGQRVAACILEVPLYPHGAEQEEANSDRGRELQGIGHGARVGRSRYDGAGRAPGQLGGPPARVTDGEAHALV